jgi:tight adherence protein B
MEKLTEYPILLQFLIAILSGVSFGLLVLLALKKLDQFLVRFLNRPQKPVYPVLWPKVTNNQKPSNLTTLLAWSGLKVNTVKLSLLVCVIGMAFSIVIFSQAFLFFIFMVGFAGILWTVVSKAKKNKQKFILQLPDTLSILTSSLKAGFSLPQALVVVERETLLQTKEIFGALVRATQLQIPIYTAAKNMLPQVGLQEWEMVSEGFGLQGRVGGNIISLFEDISNSLRDKSRVEREVESATAAGRLSGIIIASLAPFSFLLFYIFAPSFIAPMLNTPTGQFWLVFAAVLELLGFYAIWKITSIDF